MTRRHRDADDPAMAPYQKEFAKQPNANNNYAPGTVIGGWIAGELTVKVLESLGTLDRQSSIDAVQHLRYDAETVVNTGSRCSPSQATHICSGVRRSTCTMQRRARNDRVREPEGTLLARLTDRQSCVSAQFAADS